MSEWQPIETAKEDGEEVMIFAGCCVIAKLKRSRMTGERWWESDSGETINNPTHWAELPEPPKC